MDDVNKCGVSISSPAESVYNNNNNNGNSSSSVSSGGSKKLINPKKNLLNNNSAPKNDVYESVYSPEDMSEMGRMGQRSAMHNSNESNDSLAINCSNRNGYNYINSPSSSNTVLSGGPRGQKAATFAAATMPNAMKSEHVF